MAFVNLPPNLQDMFNNLQDQINKLTTGPNQAMYTAEYAEAQSTQATQYAIQASIEAGNAQAQAVQALAQATIAYNEAIQSLQPSASTIVNASNQITAIAANGITVYSGSSSSSGARVVMNSLGLAGYDSSNNATFSISASTGAAVFSGSVTGSTITGGTLNIAGNAIINSSGLLTATGATITGTINATAGYFGTVSNGWSISSTGITGVGTGSITGGAINGSVITGGTIQTSAGTTAVKMVGSTNSIDFIYGGATVGKIIPWTSNGIYISYGSGSYPATYVGSSTAVLAGSSTIDIYSGSTGNGYDGTFTGYGDFNITSSYELRVPFAYSNTTTNAATVWISSTGQLRRSTASSERYKTDIVNLVDVPELDPTALYNLPVRAFRFKPEYLKDTDDRANLLVPGFIAEEVDAIYPIAADYIDSVESWNDRMIVPALLALIQEQNERIKILEGK